MTAAKSHRLARQSVIAMLAGTVLGVGMNRTGTAPWVQPGLVDGLLHVVGTVFVSALKMMVVPRVFASLVVAVTSLSDLKALGRIGVNGSPPLTQAQIGMVPTNPVA